MPELTGSSQTIEIAAGGYRLQAPGLVGSVAEMSAEQSATRSDSGLLETGLMEATENAGIVSGKVFEIQIERDEMPGATSATRSDGLTATTRSGDPALIFSMPALGKNIDYAVLHTDEGGVSSWILPESSEAEGEAVRFHLPRESAPAPAQEEDPQATRGPISKLGRRLVRVLAWKTKDLLGKPIMEAAKKWEDSRRPYRFVGLSPQGFRETVDWSNLMQGRALMLIHGTFSKAESSYLFGKETLERLNQHYKGRIFAFNHPSLHQSPTDNIQTLLNMLPDGAKLDVDIITHSRGGLVGRVLSDRLESLNNAGRQVHVNKAVLVAAPNQGSILTDPENGLELVDRYTNMLTNLPDNAYTLVIEGVLALVKLLGYGALSTLPGLTCLRPGNDYLNALNAAPQGKTTYYALAADYTPESAALLERFRSVVADQFIDSVFNEKNDMVVPTEGCYQSGSEAGAFVIPPERRRIFTKGINHSGFFGTPVADEQIVSWLVS